MHMSMNSANSFCHQIGTRYNKKEDFTFRSNQFFFSGNLVVGVGIIEMLVYKGATYERYNTVASIP